MIILFETYNILKIYTYIKGKYLNNPITSYLIQYYVQTDRAVY